jgi:hypothetical protein
LCWRKRTYAWRGHAFRMVSQHSYCMIMFHCHTLTNGKVCLFYSKHIKTTKKAKWKQDGMLRRKREGQQKASKWQWDVQMKQWGMSASGYSGKAHCQEFRARMQASIVKQGEEV